MHQRSISSYIGEQQSPQGAPRCILYATFPFSQLYHLASETVPQAGAPQLSPTPATSSSYEVAHSFAILQWLLLRLIQTIMETPQTLPSRYL